MGDGGWGMGNGERGKREGMSKFCRGKHVNILYVQDCTEWTDNLHTTGGTRLSLERWMPATNRLLLLTDDALSVKDSIRGTCLDQAPQREGGKGSKATERKRGQALRLLFWIPV